MKKFCALGLCLVLLFLLTACGTHLEGGQPDQEILSNGKIALQQGDYIYYINGSMPATLDSAQSPTPQSTIYRMKADGTDKQQLSDKKAYDFYIYEDTVYYLGPVNADTLGVFKTSINGGVSKKVLSLSNGDTYCFGAGGIAVEYKQGLVILEPKTDKQYKVPDVGDIAQIYLTQSHVYYTITNRAGVNRLNYQGGDATKVAERNGKILGINGNTLYYIKSNEYVNSVDMTTLVETQLSNTIYKTMQLSIEHNTIVGVDNNGDKTGLYVMKLDGSTRVKIIDQLISAYVLGKNEIYYYDGARLAIYAIDYNGENGRKLADAQAVAGPGDTGADYYMDIVGEDLYFFNALNSSNIYRINLSGTPSLTILQDVKES